MILSYLKKDIRCPLSLFGIVLRAIYITHRQLQIKLATHEIIVPIFCIRHTRKARRYGQLGIIYYRKYLSMIIIR